MNLIRYIKAGLYEIFKPKTARVLGFKIFINPDDKSVCREIWMNGVYEPFETEQIENLVKEGMTVVDGGGNIGYYTLIMSKLVGKNGKVYTFEPDPMNFEYLKKNVETNSLENVILVKKGLSDKNSREKMSRFKGNAGGSTIVNYQNSNYFEIECVSLDDFTNEKIDFIKMDIEGAEPLAIAGMTKLIDSNPDLQLITENGSNSEKYLKFLLQRFQVFRIDEIKKKTIEFSKSEIPMALKRPAVPGYQNFYCRRRSRTDVHINTL